VSRKEVIEMGGKALFKKYASLEAVLRGIYPDFAWQSTKFQAANKIRPRHWQNEDNVVQALERAEIQLGIKQVGLLLPT